MGRLAGRNRLSDLGAVHVAVRFDQQLRYTRRLLRGAATFAGPDMPEHARTAPDRRARDRCQRPSACRVLREAARCMIHKARCSGVPSGPRWSYLRSEIPHERKAVVVEVPKGELAGAP
jgi:hypothetical protein